MENNKPRTVKSTQHEPAIPRKFFANDFKYQTIGITGTVSTAGDTITTRTQLLPDASRVVGIAFYENNVQTVAAPYSIKVRDDNQTYQEMTTKQDYVTPTNVGFYDKYKPYNIPAASNYLTFDLRANGGIAPATPISITVVVLLQNR